MTHNFKHLTTKELADITGIPKRAIRSYATKPVREPYAPKALTLLSKSGRLELALICPRVVIDCTAEQVKAYRPDLSAKRRLLFDRAKIVALAGTRENRAAMKNEVKVVNGRIKRYQFKSVLTGKVLGEIMRDFPTDDQKIPTIGKISPLPIPPKSPLTTEKITVWRRLGRAAGRVWWGLFGKKVAKSGGTYAFPNHPRTPTPGGDDWGYRPRHDPDPRIKRNPDGSPVNPPNQGSSARRPPPKVIRVEFVNKGRE